MVTISAERFKIYCEIEVVPKVAKYWKFIEPCCAC